VWSQGNQGRVGEEGSKLSPAEDGMVMSINLGVVIMGITCGRSRFI
jgi:hypothetical protein